jgi:hypothetical protein
MAAILKWPAQGILQLDAIIIREGRERTCLACGPEGTSRECVDLFLECFRFAARSLQNDPTGQKTDVEAALSDQLRHAHHALTVEQILDGLGQTPFPSKP